MSEKKSFLLVIILVALISPAGLFSQVPVEISKQKIVAEGKVYFMHQVLKGQTLYSISKAYNVPVDLIKKENAIADTGIREGQMLRIPDAPAPTKEPVNNTAARADKETPGAPAAATSATVIRQTQVQKPGQEEKYIYHRVVRGETLASVARQYNVSVRELKRANKGLLFPEEGEYLMIPRLRSDSGRTIAEQEPEKKEQSDTIQAVATDTVTGQMLPDTIVFSEEKSIVTDLRGSARIAVMLPFFVKENSYRTYVDSTKTDNKGRRIYKEVSLPGNWLYEGSVPFIEMYEGILIAVDSLRALGLGIELDVYDTGVDTARIDKLISSGELDNADLIIGPVFSFNLSRISAFAAERNIPVVSPVPLRDPNILDNRPTLFRVCPSHETSQDVLVREITSNHAAGNIVFLYADSLMLRPETGTFWQKLTDEVSARYDTDSSLITPYFFPGENQKLSTYQRITSIEALLKPDKENIIILASTETPVVSSVFSTLHALEKKYDIRVFGYPEIASLPTIDLRYYYDMQLVIPTETYIDFNREATRKFVRAYLRKFNTEPSQESFAWRGFDLAFYFISGLAMEGKSMVKRPWKHNIGLVTHDFRFWRENNQNGFENAGMFILHYNRNMTISVTAPTQSTSR